MSVNWLYFLAELWLNLFKLSWLNCDELHERMTVMIIPCVIIVVFLWQYWAAGSVLHCDTRLWPHVQSAGKSNETEPVICCVCKVACPKLPLCAHFTPAEPWPPARGVSLISPLLGGFIVDQFSHWLFMICFIAFCVRKVKKRPFIMTAGKGIHKDSICFSLSPSFWRWGYFFFICNKKACQMPFG